MTNPSQNQIARARQTHRSSEFSSERHSHSRFAPSRFRDPEMKALRVMKFGGTSVADAACIAGVVEIIRSAALESDVVVVVSAMSGVTNQLVAAASHAQAGDGQTAAAILEQLHRQHETAAHCLIGSGAERSRIVKLMQELLRSGERLCQGIVLLGELTPRTRDAISSLGERLSVLLVAAGLSHRGVRCEAIEATELVVTDGCHGSADPCMEPTRQRCEALRTRLRQGVIPVVTGFIGATADGVLTTLGRGGSDYSATILGAALEADEITIWTDVDGLQTADPRMVPGAHTLAEVSYREAAELAYFGANVLHAKTLRAVMQCGIPLWIRNTFAPQQRGTRITPAGLPNHPLPNHASPNHALPNDAGMKAVTAISEVALITAGGPGLAGAQDVLGRALRATAAVRADVLLISQASSLNQFSLAIPSAQAKTTLEALRHEFAHELRHEAAENDATKNDATRKDASENESAEHETAEHFSLDTSVAMVTMVGRNLRLIPGIAGSALAALGREGVNLIGCAMGSECTMSFVVPRKDVKRAVNSLHAEFTPENLEQPTQFEEGNRRCAPAPVQLF